MSLIPEEQLGMQGGDPEEQNTQRTYRASSQEAAPYGNAPSGRSSANDKYLAIKRAVRQQEENAEAADAQAAIADRVRRMKSAKEHPEEGQYVRRQSRNAPARTQQRPKKQQSTASHPSRQKSGKKSSGKKTRKRGLDLFPHRGDSPFEVIRKTVFLMSSTVFMVCLFLIGKYFWENYQNGLKNEEIRNLHRQVYVPEKEQEMVADESFRYYALLPEAKILLEKNPETVGWIRIPTNDENAKSPVDYPIVQHAHPNDLEDPNVPADDGNVYYLDKDFYRNYEKAGSIFMDYRNYFDKVENGMRLYANSQNLIIYGHNMHDYSMFGSLKYYINDATYYDNHPIIELNSNYVKYKYKIFGMIIVDVDDTTETAFDYWNVLNFDNETEFYDYVNEIKRRTVRLTDVDVTYGDQLLTLSTCNSTFSQGRLVVFARLLREGEDLMEGCTSTENPNIKWPNSYYKWHKNTYDPNAEFVPYH